MDRARCRDLSAQRTPPLRLDARKGPLRASCATKGPLDASGAQARVPWTQSEGGGAPAGTGRRTRQLPGGGGRTETYAWPRTTGTLGQRVAHLTQELREVVDGDGGRDRKDEHAAFG